MPTITLDLSAPLPANIIAKALAEATPKDLRSAVARLTSAMRKTRSGGHNGGRPKKVPSSPNLRAKTSQ